MQSSVSSTFILCNFHVCKLKNASIKGLNALRTLMIFYVYIYMKERGWGLMHAPPWGRRGFKPRIRPPYPQRVVKGD